MKVTIDDEVVGISFNTEKVMLSGIIIYDPIVYTPDSMTHKLFKCG